MLQIVQTRILSVVLWYYLAFLVISIAMFGITAGTVWVYLWNGPAQPRRILLSALGGRHVEIGCFRFCP